MNHAPLRILTGAAALVLSVSLLTGAAVPVRSLPAASGEETVLARPSLQDPDTLARAVACQSLSYYRPELLDRYLAYGRPLAGALPGGRGHPGEPSAWTGPFTAMYPRRRSRRASPS